jgi:hypothetical protein
MGQLAKEISERERGNVEEPVVGDFAKLESARHWESVLVIVEAEAQTVT